MMHSCSAGTASFFLAVGEESVQCSVSHTINIAWNNGEGKESSLAGSAEPLLVPRIIASETTYVFVQNSHGINVTDPVQTYFHPLFPAGFFVPYDYIH